MSMFSDLAEDVMEIFMDDFTVYGSSFEHCLQKFGDSTSQVPRQEPSFNFMVIEGIVLGHLISVVGLEVDQAKVSIIKTLLPLTTVNGIRSFLGHAGFYRRFIRDFSKNGKTIMQITGEGCQV